MNGASYTTPGMSGTTTKQGEFKKGGHGGGASKGDGAVDAGENRWVSWNLWTNVSTFKC